MKALFDPAYQRYPSQRYPIYARGGMVNASSPQAAAAGLEILRRGGNAMDAAVAAASHSYLKAYAIDCMLTPFLFCFMGYYLSLIHI